MSYEHIIGTGISLAKNLRTQGKADSAFSELEGMALELAKQLDAKTQQDKKVLEEIRVAIDHINQMLSDHVCGKDERICLVQDCLNTIYPLVSY